MGINQFIQLGEQCSAILVSGKLFNNGEGLTYPTKGRLLVPSGYRYTFLMASQANAKSMPSQQTPIIGQMAPNWLKVL